MIASYGSTLVLMAGAVMGALASASGVVQAQQASYVRIAQIEVDPARLGAYRAALKEEIETSVRVEPGVLALHAVAEKDNPVRILILEMYADTEAYKAHIETPHFLKYKSGTQQMVKSLKLLDTVPISLSAKPG